MSSRPTQGNNTKAAETIGVIGIGMISAVLFYYVHLLSHLSTPKRRIDITIISVIMGLLALILYLVTVWLQNVGFALFIAGITFISTAVLHEGSHMTLGLSAIMQVGVVMALVAGFFGYILNYSLRPDGIWWGDKKLYDNSYRDE